MHLVFGALFLGFVVVLVLAWYHGERGAQHISGPELLLIALALAIGGGLLWHFGHVPSPGTGTRGVAATHGAGKVRATRTATAARKAAAVPATGASVATAAATPTTALPIPAKSVAVLPFENLSADKNNAYFAAGMQDLILTKLADIGGLKVIARTSTEQYKSHPDDLDRIGRQLGVATFLEGSVQKAGNQVLINVQLINARTDAHIWAKSYQRTLKNIFGVEGEVADKVAKALNAKLTTAEATQVAAVPTTDPAAYNAYLRGEYHMTKFGHGNEKPDVVAAVHEFADAVQADPKFALAWARLATAQQFLGDMTQDDAALAARLFANAKASLAKALALQPNLAAAYIAQGIWDSVNGGGAHAALTAFNKAHALQPHNANALLWIAGTLDALGKTEESIRVLRQVQAIDPKRAAAALGGAEAYLHHFADAEREMKRALAINPDSWRALASLASLYAYLGDLPSMGKLIGNAPRSIKTNPNFTDTVGSYLFYRRDWAAARKLYAQAKEPQNLCTRRSIHWKSSAAMSSGTREKRLRRVNNISAPFPCCKRN